MNKKIEALIENGNLEMAWDEINEYEKLQPSDMDINTYRFLCAVYTEEFEAAFEYARKALKSMPYLADVHFNYAYACQLCQKIYDAYKHYGIAKKLVELGNSHQFDFNEIERIMKELVEEINLDIEQSDVESIAQKKQYIDYLLNKENLIWEINQNIFHSNYEIITREYMDYMTLPKLYVAFGANQDLWNVDSLQIEKSTLWFSSELQRASKEIQEISFETQRDNFLPIVMLKEGELQFEINGKQAIIPKVSVGRYINFRIPKGKITISSEQPFRVGTMVPIEHSPQRKHLVLNIFVDGLSQTVLQENFETLMPYTYKFFKKGMICSNAYTAADWTFPSIASTVTGQSMVKHQMIHSKVLRELDEDTPLLFEYFQEAGYNTTKIGGNWRITPNYGYARGMNRVFYQHHYSGYSAERVVSETVEQIHSMRETDQFIWMEIGELHKIADGLDFSSHMSEFWVFDNQHKQVSINSVKQNYNPMLIRYYQNQIQYIDRKLAVLYQHIEENYSEEEILISLFSDHGQGYLLKPDESFLDKGRSNVAFMIRGNGICGNTDEIISTCDYAGIMCKLAGIPYCYEATDGHLPHVFGGEKEREFAVVESIHVGDPYMVSLKGKDFVFYLYATENVTQECRVPLDACKIMLQDYDGNQIDDEVKIKYLTNYCLEHIAPCVIWKN